MISTRIRSVWAITAVLCLVLAAHAGPQIDIEKETIDIGTVNESRDDTVRVEFKIRNAGDDSLKVTSVRTNCGCVVAGYDTVTAPGDTCTIRSEFHPTGLSSGPFKKMIFVSSNAENESRQQLSITGNMLAHIDVSTRILNLPIDDSIPAPLLLESRKDDLAVEQVGFTPVDDIEGDPLPLRYSLHPLDSTRQDDYRIYRLNVYNSQGLTGPMFGVFSIQTNHEEKPEIRLRGSIERM